MPIAPYKQQQLRQSQIRVFLAKHRLLKSSEFAFVFAHRGGVHRLPITAYLAQPQAPPSAIQPTRSPNSASSAISQAQKLEIGVFSAQLVRGKREKKSGGRREPVKLLRYQRTTHKKVQQLRPIPCGATSPFPFPAIDSLCVSFLFCP